MDRLTSLSVFGQVVQSGGFSAAARRLKMSVTHVSSHIQSLEDALGARLLNRTTRKVSLTETGRAYYERTVRILSELDEANRMAGALQAIPCGTLRLHTHPSLVRFLAPVVAGYLEQFPDVTIDLTTGERMVDLVEEGFDLAIRPTPPPGTSFILRRLTSWRYMLCCSPAYLHTHALPIVPADLSQHNCLRYAAGPFDTEWPFESPSGDPVSVRISGNMVTNSADILLSRALDGGGVLLAPSFVVAKEIAAGSLVQLLTEFRGAEFTISAIYPSRHQLSAKVRVFLDQLVTGWKPYQLPADDS